MSKLISSEEKLFAADIATVMEKYGVVLASEKLYREDEDYSGAHYYFSGPHIWLEIDDTIKEWQPNKPLQPELESSAAPDDTEPTN